MTHSPDTSSADVDMQIDELFDKSNLIYRVETNTEGDLYYFQPPYDQNVNKGVAEFKQQLKQLLAQQTVAARLEEREAAQKMWKREHDHWKNTAEQFIKREQLKTEVNTEVLKLLDELLKQFQGYLEPNTDFVQEALPASVIEDMKLRYTK